MEVDESWITSIIVEKNSSNPNGICKIIKFNAEPGVGKYQNSTSDIIRVTVDVQLNSGDVTCKSYIYKREKKMPENDPFENLNLFQIESLMYSKYLNEMATLIHRYDKSKELPWPLCYGFKSDVLLLEDLKDSGFVTIAKKSGGMNLNHASLVTKQIAHYHSLTAVLLHDGIIDPADFGPSVFHMNLPLINNLHQCGLTAMANSILANNWGAEWKSTADSLRTLSENIGLKMQRLGESTKESNFIVLNHGDCWTNNIMFKYNDDTSSPIGFKFIDFQVGHVNNFAWDLTYFFYNCLLPDFRRDNIEKLLDIYTEDLTEWCKKYQYKEKVPSREEVQRSMDNILLYGFVNSISTMPLLLSVDKPDFEFDLEKLMSAENDSPATKDNPFQSLQYSDKNFIEMMKRELRYFSDLKII